MKRHRNPLLKESAKKIDCYSSIHSIELDNPLNFYQVSTSRNKEKWIKSIKDKLKNTYRNKNITSIRNIPNNKPIISTKWVFATKRDKNNNLSKYKALLVASGFI
jgi:hypothetical protein